jgi:hypothetical protein
MQRVRDQLAKSGKPDFYLEFTERATNKEWPRRCQEWALSTGADYILSIQDDTLQAPNFWPALRAMLVALPDRLVLGLSAVNPKGPEIARQGHRFYATRSHLVGWGHLMDRETIREFLAWQGANPERVDAENEDQLINSFVGDTGRISWHPVPSILDHDVSVDSVYGNTDHTHRRSTVTWHGYPAEALEDPAWWAHNGKPPLLDCPPPQACSWCGYRPGEITNGSGMNMCRLCLGELMLGAMGIKVQKDTAPAPKAA